MTSLLPASSSDIYELVLEATRDERWAELRAAVPAIRTGKRISPRPDVLPYLVFEEGLGQLTPYVENVYDLLDGGGRRWMWVRGTYEAVDRGLAFLGLSATAEPAWHGRVWWNSSQLRFPALPATDDLLGQIEGITRLSLPMRSDLRRGVHQYDVGPLLGDHARLDCALLEHESGVRLHEDGTLWSLGRRHEVAHDLVKAECLAAGIWIEPDWTAAEEASPPWVTLDIPWIDADFPWAVAGARAIREQTMAGQLVGQSLYLALRDDAGDLIGYRRCRAARPVALEFGGPYVVAGQAYAPSNEAGSAIIYIEAITDFGDAGGIDGGAVALAVGGELAAGVKPGKLWLQPGELTGAAEIAVHPIAVRLRNTVREQVAYLLRFAAPPPPPALVAIGEEPTAFGIDFTDGRYALRVTRRAEQALGDEAGLALDFVDGSFAERF